MRRLFESHSRLLCRGFYAALCLIILFTAQNAVQAAEGYRIYALACPFATVSDELELDGLLAAVQDDPALNGEIREIVVSPDAAADLPELFASIPSNRLDDDAAQHIAATDDGVICAVIPVDQMNPTMKAIRVGHAAFPWDDIYDPETDPLAVSSDEPNFDPERVTTLLLTGTTALARTVAYKMFVNGAIYPAELIKSVFDASDITHISNESSIWDLCPEPRIDNTSLQFCSNANAMELLDYLGVDVIELSGNHLRDYDWMPFLEMLDRFDETGYAYYAAGRDADEASRPLFIEHNGNRFAFIGCNIAGPEHVFVDDGHPGVNHCDFDAMEEQVRSLREEGVLDDDAGGSNEQVRSLREEGWLVIVTLQYYELYIRTPSEMQERDFQRLSDAGAVIVSGSQAHLAQSMKPMKDRFIHYGLGNLFFDQMDIPVKGTRQEFLDRYVFYDGRLLTVQLVTALLTDYSRPRLMTDAERTEFLSEMLNY